MTTIVKLQFALNGIALVLASGLCVAAESTREALPFVLVMVANMAMLLLLSWQVVRDRRDGGGA
jgi:hypothetical protein